MKNCPVNAKFCQNNLFVDFDFIKIPSHKKELTNHYISKKNEIRYTVFEYSCYCYICLLQHLDTSMSIGGQTSRLCSIKMFFSKVFYDNWFFSQNMMITLIKCLKNRHAPRVNIFLSAKIAGWKKSHFPV